jgi:hypothetical protein
MTGRNRQDPCQAIYREKGAGETRIALPLRYASVNVTTQTAIELRGFSGAAKASASPLAVSIAVEPPQHDMGVEE